MFFITSCYKDEIEPTPIIVEDVFTLNEIIITNGQSISFKLDDGGIYILKLIDAETLQTLSKEKIPLIQGKNTINIFTKSIQNEYLYLVLEDFRKNEIKKVKLINK